MQKKRWNFKTTVLQLQMKWIAGSTDAKLIRWKVDRELKYRNQADNTWTHWTIFVSPKVKQPAITCFMI